MIFSPFVQRLLENKCGHPLRTPADVERLMLDIEGAVGERVGISTLKRLFGIFADERTPRVSTLDIIARYLEYENWDTLAALDLKSNSAFEAEGELHTNELPTGQQVEVLYEPNRRLVLAHREDDRFVVMEAESSKIQKGDVLRFTHLAAGYPLFVSQVTRGEANLGSFTAGIKQGIRYKLLP